MAPIITLGAAVVRPVMAPVVAVGVSTLGKVGIAIGSAAAAILIGRKAVQVYKAKKAQAEATVQAA